MVLRLFNASSMAEISSCDVYFLSVEYFRSSRDWLSTIWLASDSREGFTSGNMAVVLSLKFTSSIDWILF
mgnify:CR=1 FL=1